MGRTYRGTRKQFGSQKSQQHRARSKWTAQNGTRLRTLNVDLVEFMDLAGPDAEVLHRPPNLSEKAEKTLGRVIDVVISEKKTKSSTKAVVPKNTGASNRQVTQWLSKLTTEQLEARKAYAARQVSHLHKLSLGLASLGASFKPAIQRFTERRRYWDKQVGIIGPILVERQT